MASFLKVLFRNVLQGPSTDPFPLGETFTPDRQRGRVKIDPDLCMGCGMCKYSCAAGAIDIRPQPEGKGFTITVWRNSCCLCASCRHYCPTGAATLTNDWHTAHAQEDKYNIIEQQKIDYVPCAQCGTLMRPLPKKLAERLYAYNTEIDRELIRTLCPECRRMLDARRNAGALEKAPAAAEAPADATS